LLTKGALDFVEPTHGIETVNLKRGWNQVVGQIVTSPRFSRTESLDKEGATAAFLPDFTSI